MAAKIQLKRGSGPPPILAPGEPAFDETNHALYVGDGVTNTKIGPGAGGTWGSITGILASQSDLQTALNGKQPEDPQLDSISSLSYTGNSLKVIRVNTGETGFELATVSGSGGIAVTTDILKGNNDGTALPFGSTLVGRNLLSSTNPSAITFPKVAADNSVSYRTPTQLASDIGAITGVTADSPLSGAGTSGSHLTIDLTGYTPTSRTVNGHALSSNVTVTNADLGAVPTSTTVNGHALSSNVTVAYHDLAFDDLALSGVTSAGTATLVPGRWYYGTLSSALTIAFSTTPSLGGPSTGIRIHVTSPFTLTFPSAYEVGSSSNPITTLAVTTGDHEISWVWSNGQHWVADSLGSPVGAIVGTTDTQTLTNKRITARVTTITSSATPTINTDNCDAVSITALATAITSMTTNLTGTPNDFDQLIFRILDNASPHAITWGASFIAKGATLPTTTTASKLLTVLFIWDVVTTKWGCVSVATEA